MCRRSFLISLELLMIVVRLHASKIEQKIEIKERVNAPIIVCVCNEGRFSKTFSLKSQKYIMDGHEFCFTRCQVNQ